MIVQSFGWARAALVLGLRPCCRTPDFSSDEIVAVDLSSTGNTSVLESSEKSLWIQRIGEGV